MDWGTWAHQRGKTTIPDLAEHVDPIARNQNGAHWQPINFLRGSNNTKYTLFDGTWLVCLYSLADVRASMQRIIT